MKCQSCEYEWKSRVKNPKACPRCKGRLDFKYNIRQIPRSRKSSQDSTNKEQGGTFD